MVARITHTLVAVCASLALFSSATRAAEVTYQRLLNPEPQNWLMNHHDFGAHRYSALDIINKSNVKKLKLAFAVALGGTSGNENLEATPLVDDGFMYMADAWGVVYKIDVRSGTFGRIIWKMDPGQEKIDRNRGVALWGNLVISVTGDDGRVIATDKDTGKIVWDKNLDDQPDLTLNAAPLALKDAIIVGASGGDPGVRDWLAALDPKTGNLQWKTYSVPAPGEPGSETWKDKNNAWQTGGGAFYVTGSYDPATNLTYWGSGNPTPKYDSSYRPGDNLFTDSALAHRCRDRQDRLVSPVHAQRHDGLRRDRHAHPHRRGGQRRGPQDPRPCGPQRLLLHLRPPQRPIPQGHPIRADGDLDQGHRSEDRQAADYDPAKDLQTYAEPVGKILAGERSSRRVPGGAGRQQFLAGGLQRKNQLLYIPELEGCTWITRDQTRHVPGNFDGGGFGYDGRLTSGLVVVDPATAEVKQRKAMPYANTTGALATAGGIVVTALIDGTVMALDDQTLDELWSINVGTGINAPPMTYAVDGKQYIAIATGLTANQKGRVATTPELKRLGTGATMIFVFGL